MTRLEAIRARWEGATPGPWREDGMDDERLCSVDVIGSEWTERDGVQKVLVYLEHPYTSERTSEADIEAIAAAPDDVAFLCERVRRLELALRVFVARTGELTNWDWMCLLADHPDAEEVTRDASAIEALLPVVGRFLNGIETAEDEAALEGEARR